MCEPESKTDCVMIGVIGLAITSVGIAFGITTIVGTVMFIIGTAVVILAGLYYPYNVGDKKDV